MLSHMLIKQNQVRLLQHIVSPLSVNVLRRQIFALPFMQE